MSIVLLKLFFKIRFVSCSGAMTRSKPTFATKSTGILCFLRATVACSIFNNYWTKDWRRFYSIFVTCRSIDGLQGLSNKSQTAVYHYSSVSGMQSQHLEPSPCKITVPAQGNPCRHSIKLYAFHIECSMRMEQLSIPVRDRLPCCAESVFTAPIAPLCACEMCIL